MDDLVVFEMPEWPQPPPPPADDRASSLGDSGSGREFSGNGGGDGIGGGWEQKLAPFLMRNFREQVRRAPKRFTGGRTVQQHTNYL